MSPCAVNRYLVPAALGGSALALATGNGWLGWVGGALVASVLWLRRDAAADTACAWSPQPVDHGDPADLDASSEADAEATLTSTHISPER